MWSANVVGKEYSGGVLKLNVSYSNGADAFNEIATFGGVDLYTVSNVIQGKIDVLNKTDTLASTAAVGAFTPISKTFTSTPDTVFSQKLTILRQAKAAVDLGVITNTDPIYTTALSDVQKSFDVSFLFKF